MNQGIAAARGAIVAHLHADDYYAGPDVLARGAAVRGERRRLGGRQDPGI